MIRRLVRLSKAFFAEEELGFNILSSPISQQTTLSTTDFSLCNQSLTSTPTLPSSHAQPESLSLCARKSTGCTATAEVVTLRRATDFCRQPTKAVFHLVFLVRTQGCRVNANGVLPGWCQTVYEHTNLQTTTKIDCPVCRGLACLSFLLEPRSSKH
jgi:hypothetical protein